MTETDSRQTDRLGDAIQQYLVDHHALGDQEKITGAVLVIETETVMQGQPVTGRHRVRPLGPMSPSAEFGMLQKAADNARGEDGCPFCR